MNFKPGIHSSGQANLQEIQRSRSLSNMNFPYDQMHLLEPHCREFLDCFCDSDVTSYSRIVLETDIYS